MRPVNCPFCHAAVPTGRLCPNCGGSLIGQPPQQPKAEGWWSRLDKTEKTFFKCFGAFLSISFVVILSATNPLTSPDKTATISPDPSPSPWLRHSETAEQAVKPARPVKPSATRQGHHEPIGVSYGTAMAGLSDAFQMEQVVSVDGYDHFLGRSSNRMNILEIVGDKSDIFFGYAFVHGLQRRSDPFSSE
jgi:hypothetical protein